MIFTDLIERNASTLPDAVAVRGGETSFTWSELARASRRLAGGLRALGAGPRDRVAILARCCAGYLVAIHGAAWGGQILVPLNTRLAGPELVAQLEDSDARIILVDAAHMHATADWPDRWRRRIVRISGDGRIAVEAAEIRERYAFAPGDTVTILYTGGTTGRAKGVELSSIAMLENGRIVADMLELAQRDISLLTAPLFHISGSGMVWATAVTGAGLRPCPGLFSSGGVPGARGNGNDHDLSCADHDPDAA